MNKPLVIALSLLFLVSGSFVAYLLLQKTPSQNSLSPNILLLTQPITSFTGTVDKISGNTLTLTQKIVVSPLNILPPSSSSPSSDIVPSPLPSPTPNTLTYQVVVTDQTGITQSPFFVNYLFRPLAPPSNTPINASLKDIREGQDIIVSTNSDLRTLSGNQFEATSINLPSIQNTLSGTIASISDNTLVIKTFVSPSLPASSTPENDTPPTPQEKDYTLTVTSDTEISKIGNQGKPQRFSLSDLQENQSILVYTDKDINITQELTALRIEPMAVFIPPTSPKPVPSPQP